MQHRAGGCEGAPQPGAGEMAGEMQVEKKKSLQVVKRDRDLEKEPKIETRMREGEPL